LGATLAFDNEVQARVQGGDVRTAKALVDARVGGKDVSPSIRNVAINALIALGAYEAALRNQPAEHLPQSPLDALQLVLCQINLAEYHFTRIVALLAAGRLDDAETVLWDGEKAARRPSSKRNAIFLRARIAAARGDWVAAERHCRLAANHPFRTQGGDGLLLWAEALDELDRTADAAEARRLVLERDPESEAARAIAAASSAA